MAGQTQGDRGEIAQPLPQRYGYPTVIGDSTRRSNLLLHNAFLCAGGLGVYDACDYSRGVLGHPLCLGCC